MSVQISDEEDLITSEQSPRFKKVPTLAAAITQIVLSLAQIILVFLLPSLYDKHAREGRSFGSFSLLIYTHGAHWAAFLIIDQFLHHHHHKSRLQGYLEFYVRTKNIRRAPFYILSVGNAVLMIVVMILHDLCDSDKSCSHTFTKVDYLRGLITLESLVVICLVVSYILILTDFHNKQLPPDVLRNDLNSSIMQNTSQDDVIGCLEPDQMVEVLERQAEMIRYLHEHSENLGRKILVLTSQLSQKERMA
eukprot:GFUD01013943.1.p1 GENE.GFUD01013943.1~~GFUD01013943.1.p1  ORF type:complete len:249 (+),score=64.58 GFUD01013943.1:116-862(+)